MGVEFARKLKLKIELQKQKDVTTTTVPTTASVETTKAVVRTEEPATTTPASTLAYIIRGNGEGFPECSAKTNSKTSNPPFGQNADITVSCCGTSNSNLIRKYSTGDCYPRGKTYEEARIICSNSGGRVCTKGELVSGIGRGKGCNGDNFMTWTSDKCNYGNEDTVTQSPTTSCRSDSCCSYGTVYKNGKCEVEYFVAMGLFTKRVTAKLCVKV